MSEQTKQPPTLSDLRAHREEILDLAAKYGVSNVRVFGSVARGDARPDSDVDLLVDLPPQVSLMKLSALVQDLQTLLGRTVDVVDASQLKERIRERVLQQARLLGEIEPGEDSMGKDDRLYLDDILTYAQRILTFTAEGKAAFLDSLLIQEATFRCFEVIGEAANKVDPDLQKRYPDVPWASMVEMRNRLIHGYQTVNLEMVWQTIEDDIPPVLDSVKKIIAALDAEEGDA